MARDSQNLKEEFGVFMTYAKIYEKLNNYLTARNFYERALVLARTLEDSKQEVFLVDKLTKLPKH